MAPKESEICKQAVVGSTRHITLTIPDTLEIIWKPGSATCQCVIITPQIIDFLHYTQTQGKNYV
jgi:hypothetical protein